MGSAIEEGGAPPCENKLIAFETFTTLCENPALYNIDKVVGLRRNPII